MHFCFIFKLTTYLDRENKHSQGTTVAGDVKYFLANLTKTGCLFSRSFNHGKGFKSMPTCCSSHQHLFSTTRTKVSVVHLQGMMIVHTSAFSSMLVSLVRIYHLVRIFQNMQLLPNLDTFVLLRQDFQHLFFFFLRVQCNDNSYNRVNKSFTQTVT